VEQADEDEKLNLVMAVAAGFRVPFGQDAGHGFVTCATIRLPD
jgi:hypothetical protein